jgi:hypothetical protein
VVLHECEYQNKFNNSLGSGIYEQLSKDPTGTVTRKVWKLLSKCKAALFVDLKQKLTQYYSRPRHLYGMPKIHKPDVPLRPTVSSIGSPCYALAGFLHKILRPLAGNIPSDVKNSDHFVELLKFISLQHTDILVSFDVVSLFTDVSVDEALQVIEVRLLTEHTMAELSPLQVEAIMKLLEICLRTTYFQEDDEFFQQKDGMAIASALSPVD